MGETNMTEVQVWDVGAIEIHRAAGSEVSKSALKALNGARTSARWSKGSNGQRRVGIGKSADHCGRLRATSRKEDQRILPMPL